MSQVECNSSSILSIDLQNLPDLEQSFDSAINIEDVPSKPDVPTQPVLIFKAVSPEPEIVSGEVQPSPTVSTASGEHKESVVSVLPATSVFPPNQVANCQAASPELEVVHDESSSNTTLVAVSEIYLQKHASSTQFFVLEILSSSPAPKVDHDGPLLNTTVANDPEVNSNDNSSLTQSAVQGTLLSIKESSVLVSKVEDVPPNLGVSSKLVGLPMTVSSEFDCSTVQSTVSVASKGSHDITPTSVPEESPVCESTTPSTSSTTQPKNGEVSPRVDPDTANVSSSSTTVPEDEVFDAPGSPNNDEANPARERFFSCSPSIDEIELKQETVFLLNDLCRSLSSSTPLPSGSKVIPSSNDLRVTDLAALSESQLVQAGFFNDNDSVPDISIRLSQSNPYSTLLTENNSFG